MRTLRLQQLVTGALVTSSLFHSSSVTALPFGTRGGNKDEEEENEKKEEEQQKDSSTTTIIADAEVLDGKTINISPAAAVVGGGGSTTTNKDGHNSDRISRVVVDDFFSHDNIINNNNDEMLQIELKKHSMNKIDFLKTIRRTLHQIPELMYNEKDTSNYIQTILKQQLGITNYTTGWGKNTNTDIFPGDGGYGIVVDVGTGQDPCVLLRADMDALPIQERTEGVDSFQSKHPGKMHACGHDGHTTMLLGATALLKEMEDSIPGTVRIMFQPAEEGGAGAKRMKEEGILDLEPRPQYAFGIHVWPTLPSGSIASRPGPLLAAADRFEVLIHGVGGHAAMPHLTIDPIVTASSIVMNLQTLVSRTLSPLESGVVSVTAMEGGDAFNVIPHAVTMRGTIRALTTETLLGLKDRVEDMIQSTVTLYGCNATIDWSPDYYPPTVNDPKLFDELSKYVGSMVSEEKVLRDDVEPTMGAEDFSFIAESIPSTFFLLGQGSGTNPPTNYGLHHPHFALDESILPRGVELHVTAALHALRKLHKDNKQEQG